MVVVFWEFRGLKWVFLLLAPQLWWISFVLVPQLASIVHIVVQNSFHGREGRFGEHDLVFYIYKKTQKVSHIWKLFLQEFCWVLEEKHHGVGALKCQISILILRILLTKTIKLSNSSKLPIALPIFSTLSCVIISKGRPCIWIQKADYMRSTSCKLWLGSRSLRIVWYPLKF